MHEGKTIAFFPEACYGPALNSVGIAQECEKLGHKAVFLTDPGLSGVYTGYGFEEHSVNMSEPMPPEEMAKYWTDFIDSHIPNFDKTPFEQIDNYVKECWANIVNTSIWAEKDLPSVLRKVDPDLICIDNVILFPATKQYGVPWVRIISCSENEIPDPDIPPHLSGCGEDDKEGFQAFEAAFNEAIGPIHRQFNEFLEQCGEAPYPLGQFFEASPYLNLLLYPEPVKFNRRNQLDPKFFQYLEGCVRQEAPFEVPTFDENNNGALIYISFGSLGCGDTELLNRIIQVMAMLPYRVLVNIGEYPDAYHDLPPNVQVQEWFPQPSVISKTDLVIHHGGNNTFTECLYFGKPAIIMPYVWDGHDNATRVHETGHGLKMHRSDWTDQELAANIEMLLSSGEAQNKLTSTATHMQSKQGTIKAAKLLSELVTRQG
ncbi:MAG: glycosyltransferase [Gammaproteobacteria bacterium]|nr:glycosyltransferase [Gammaproteobacteria bacterium]MDH3466501.1 glycosyltransferase [Gammaproteobacteria bacterium]